MLLLLSCGCTRHESAAPDAGGRIVDAAIAVVVVEASDDKLPDTWCLDPKDFTPTRRVVPPFTASAEDAVQAVLNSHHFAALRKAHPSAVLEPTKGFACARRCAKPDRECGFQMRASDFAATSESNLLEWFAVDPMTRAVWFQDFAVDGGPWRSEAPR